MDLDNTVHSWNLVVLKEKQGSFNTIHCNTEFKQNKFYRANIMTNGDRKEVLVYGVIFSTDFDDIFETAQTRILRDFEILGIIKNGKVVSKAAFAKILDIHQYGRTSQTGFKIGYLMNARELIYGFFPFFRGDTKANTIKQAYVSVLDIIDGNMDCVNDHHVQFGNCGIPISASPNSRLQVRDTFALSHKMIL